VDGFVCSAGTGGTIAGCSQFLKGVNPAVSVWLIDPLGSGLFDYVNAGSEAKYTTEQVGDESVRFIQRGSGSTIAEGVGIGRVTDNLAEALIDRAVRGNNQEIVEMCYYLKEKEGVFVGPSAAMNVVGAVKLARTLPKGSTVVTILCDGGEKYTTKVYDPAWLKEQGLQAEAYKNTDDLSWIR
jgi:cysteine synthase A